MATHDNEVGVDEQTAMVRHDPTPMSIDTMTRYAKAFVVSGLFKSQPGDRGLAQAFVKIQAGQELGLPPFASMRGLNVFDGKVELAAGLMASLVKRSGRYRYRVTESTETGCTLTWFEREGTDAWEEVGTSSFTIEEAKRAGLIKDGSAWKNYPADMLFNRALSRGFRRHCPDLAAGAPVYVEGELTPPRDDTPPEGGGDGQAPDAAATIDDDHVDATPIVDADGVIVGHVTDEGIVDTTPTEQPTLDESPADRPIEDVELPDEPLRATPVQLGRIATLCEQAGVDQATVAARYNVEDIGQLTPEQASSACRALEQTLTLKANA